MIYFYKWFVFKCFLKTFRSFKLYLSRITFAKEFHGIFKQDGKETFASVESKFAYISFPKHYLGSSIRKQATRCYKNITRRIRNRQVCRCNFDCKDHFTRRACFSSYIRPSKELAILFNRNI